MRPSAPLWSASTALTLVVLLPLAWSSLSLSGTLWTPLALRRSMSHAELVSLSGAEPTVRVGVVIDEPRIAVSSPAGLRFADALTGQPAGEVGSHGIVYFTADGALLAAQSDEGAPASGVPSLVLRPAQDGAPIIIDGKAFRGAAEIRAVGQGRVTAINILPIEQYLLGVVPLEIGPRETAELAAVEAQAVAARTYAVSHLGGHVEMGFDLFGSVEDQVYGGLGAERDESTRAVQRTSGHILLFDDMPIRAFYHSTCGGRTAAVEEVLDREPAPYLQSVSDQRPDGSDYCAQSPRYRWTVAWTPDRLDSIARPGLAAHFGVSSDEVGRVDHVEVQSRTPSGRVHDLVFRGPGVALVLSRLDIRRTLRSERGILFSTDFAVTDRDDGLVELHGRGYGHGAGMCQWGAIGRARAGQTYEEILATYYPGADVVRVYGGDGG